MRLDATAGERQAIAMMKWVVRLSAALSVLFFAAGPAVANSKYAAFVVHAQSGDVLFARYADSARYPASLTKVMTLYLLFEELEAGRMTLNTPLRISRNAAGEPPSKLGVEAGSTITVEKAIEALVVRSANDVAVVVAEAIAGSEPNFARRMTSKAREIGMPRTTFRNASGLPNRRQVTTARDLATMARRIIQDFPQYAHYFSQKSFVWNGRTYRTHNRVVLTYEGATGLKTGYTRLSGYNLATTAERGGVELVGVVLGGRSPRTRDAHMTEILDRSFSRVRANPRLIASIYREPPTPGLRPDRGATDLLLARNEVLTSDADTLAMLIASAEAPFAETSAGLPEAAYGEGDASASDDAAVAVSPSPADRAFAVQIGAFRTRSDALKALSEIMPYATGSLADGEANVTEFMSNGEAYHRARFTGLSRASADDACEALKAAGKTCYVAVR